MPRTKKQKPTKASTKARPTASSKAKATARVPAAATTMPRPRRRQGNASNDTDTAQPTAPAPAIRNITLSKKMLEIRTSRYFILLFSLADVSTVAQQEEQRQTRAVQAEKAVQNEERRQEKEAAAEGIPLANYLGNTQEQDDDDAMVSQTLIRTPVLC